MPSAVIVGRASFPPFAFSSAITGMAKKIEITLFQVFSPVPVQVSTYCDCIKDGRKIDPACGLGKFPYRDVPSPRELENRALGDMLHD